MDTKFQQKNLLSLKKISYLAKELKNIPKYIIKVDKHTKKLAKRLGFISTDLENKLYDRAKFTLLAYYCCPKSSYKMLKVASDWNYWLFSFDDRTDMLNGDLVSNREFLIQIVADVTSTLESAAKSIDGVQLLNKSPHAIYAFEIVKELYNSSPVACRDVHVSRFVKHAVEYIKKGVVPATCDKIDPNADIEGFVIMRAYDSGVRSIIPLLEAGLGIYLTDYDCPKINRLEELVAIIIGLFNDVLSYEKEVLFEKRENNLMWIMMQRHGSFAEAFEQACVILKQYWQEFEALCSEIKKRSIVHTKYVGAMRDFIFGCDGWQLNSGRYMSPTSPFIELVKKESS